MVLFVTGEDDGLKVRRELLLDGGFSFDLAVAWWTRSWWKGVFPGVEGKTEENLLVGVPRFFQDQPKAGLINLTADKTPLPRVLTDSTVPTESFTRALDSLLKGPGDVHPVAASINKATVREGRTQRPRGRRRSI